MKVSIVTISYNQAQFLEQAIRSVIDQNYSDLEYIVVDAGSTDGSREIIEKYGQKIEHIIVEPDYGPPDGLNKGFGMATGSIYGFLNSDDILLPGTVKQVVDYFKSTDRVDVVSGHAYLIDGNNTIIRRLRSDRFSLKRYAYGACFLAQQSTFFKSSIFKSVGGFNPHNLCAWDGELYVSMAMAGGKFSRKNTYWSCFRSHPNAISASGRLNVLYKDYNKIIFKKIMNREFSPRDHAISLIYRVIKHLLNPKGLLDRVRIELDPQQPHLL